MNLFERRSHAASLYPTRLYTLWVEHQLQQTILWIQPNAVWLALTLPVLIRLVGHWLPEEIFMMALGVLAARAGSPMAAARLLAAAWLGHLIMDQAVFFAGRWLRPRLDRWPRLAKRLEAVTGRLGSTPSALFLLVPARVLPLGRAAWLAGAGVVDVGWGRFLAVDALALVVHVTTWCGLGWWMASDLGELAAAARSGTVLALWAAVAALIAVVAVAVWRRRDRWSSSLARVATAAKQRLRHPLRPGL